MYDSPHPPLANQPTTTPIQAHLPHSSTVGGKVLSSQAQGCPEIAPKRVIFDWSPPFPFFLFRTTRQPRGPNRQENSSPDLRRLIPPLLTTPRHSRADCERDGALLLPPRPRIALGMHPGRCRGHHTPLSTDTHHHPPLEVSPAALHHGSGGSVARRCIDRPESVEQP